MKYIPFQWDLFFTFDQDLARTTVPGNDGSLRRGGEGINHQGYVIATL